MSTPNITRKKKRSPSLERISDVACELEDLANAVWMIACGVDVNLDPDRLGSALLHVSRELRRLSNRVEDRVSEVPARITRKRQAVAA